MRPDTLRGTTIVAKWFRWTAAAALCVAAASALLTAVIDLANVTARFRETAFHGRPFWLHTFSIAMITVLVCIAAMSVSRSRAWSLAARGLYGLTAVLNITVPVLQRSHREYRFVIPSMHVVAAACLLGMIVLAAEGSSRAHGLRNGT